MAWHQKLMSCRDLSIPTTVCHYQFVSNQHQEGCAEEGQLQYEAEDAGVKESKGQA